VITTEDDDAQHVAGDAERTQSSDHVDLDDDLVLTQSGVIILRMDVLPP